MRMDRVNEQLKREISQILQQEMGDPRFTFVSITKTDVSKDLRLAKVYFRVLGDEKQAVAVQRGLEGAGRKIRRFVAQRLTMRYTPDLTFIYDHMLDDQSRIEKMLEDIRYESESSSSGDQDA